MQLRIEHLSKTYPNGTRALRDVSLEIPSGMFGLLGPNGAGKSTLMRTIATLQDADSGGISFGDIDVLRDKPTVRRMLGYLPQDFGVYPKATAEQLLDHLAVLKGITDKRERWYTVDALLQQTGLDAVRHRRLGTFSGGMRQRFGIAVSLLGNPKLIIVDEPTAGLDPAERVRFLNFLSELGEQGTVILSTHIVEDVAEVCTRMAIIDKGTILLADEPLHAIARLDGSVWKTLVDKHDVPDIELQHNVISTKLFAGKTVVRVFSGAPPDPRFEPAEPFLEDVYFCAMRGLLSDVTSC